MWDHVRCRDEHGKCYCGGEMKKSYSESGLFEVYTCQNDSEHVDFVRLEKPKKGIVFLIKRLIKKIRGW